MKATRKKDYVGSIYRRAGSDRLYLRIPPRVARLLGLPGAVATGIADTTGGRVECEEMLRELTHRFYVARGLPVRARPVALTYAEGAEMYVERALSHRTEATRKGFRYGFRAVMAHGDPATPMEAVIQRGTATVPYIEGCLEAMIATQRGVGALSAQSVEDYTRIVLSFCAWAVEEGFLPMMPRRKTLRRRMPHIAGKPIRTFEAWEVARLIAVGRDSERVAFRRMADLIDVLSRTPLRLHEALTVELRHLDRSTMTLHVERKDGRRQEYVPLRATDIEILAHVAERWNPTGGAILGYHATSDSRLRRTFYELMAVAGVERNERSFHEFKKTYITRLVSRVGKDLSLHEVSRLARCGIQVIERHYLKMGTDDLRRKLEGMYDEA